VKTSTKVVLVLFPLGIVAIVADAMWKDARPGTMVLFAPADAPVTVIVDDGAPVALAPGEVRRLEAEHGAHTVRTADGAVTRTVTVESGRQLRGVPLIAEQCFVELDVTMSHYGESAGRERPTISQSFRHAEPFAVANVWPLTESELPSHTTDRVRSDGTYADVQLVHLFRTVPCAAMDAGADATLAALGYTR
jgi:hypothetical protein